MTATTFDIALEKRFQENATISTLDGTDVLLIMNEQTGTVLRVTVSALATLINTAISNSDILAALSAPYGVATLDSGFKIPAAQLPSYVDDVLEYADSGSFPATGEAGKIYIALNTNKTYRWGGGAYTEISASPGSTDSVTEGSVNLYHTTARASAAAPVQSVSGRTGAVMLTKSDVSLENVENTAISTWAGSVNITALGTLINPLRLNNSFAIWDTATAAGAGKDLTWRMNVAGGNPVSVLGQIKPSSYTLLQGVTQNLVSLYVGAWNNNNNPGTPVVSFGSTGVASFKGRIYAPTISLSALSTFADNAAAITGGLSAGMVFKTTGGDLKIVV